MSELDNDDIATIEQAILDKQQALLNGGVGNMNDYQDLSLCLFKLELLKVKAISTICKCVGKEEGKIKLKADGLTCSQCNKEIF